MTFVDLTLVFVQLLMKVLSCLASSFIVIHNFFSTEFFFFFLQCWQLGSVRFGDVFIVILILVGRFALVYNVAMVGSEKFCRKKAHCTHWFSILLVTLDLTVPLSHCLNNFFWYYLTLTLICNILNVKESLCNYESLCLTNSNVLFIQVVLTWLQNRWFIEQVIHLFCFVFS